MCVYGVHAHGHALSVSLYRSFMALYSARASCCTTPRLYLLHPTCRAVSERARRQRRRFHFSKRTNSQPTHSPKRRRPPKHLQRALRLPSLDLPVHLVLLASLAGAAGPLTGKFTGHVDTLDAAVLQTAPAVQFLRHSADCDSLIASPQLSKVPDLSSSAADPTMHCESVVYLIDESLTRSPRGPKGFRALQQREYLGSGAH